MTESEVMLAGAACAIMGLKVVLPHLSKKGGIEQRGAEDVSKIAERIKDLHTWHDMNDEDGVKIWYIRKSLEEHIKELVAQVSKQAEYSKEANRLLKQLVNDK